MKLMLGISSMHFFGLDSFHFGIWVQEVIIYLIVSREIPAFPLQPVER